MDYFIYAIIFLSIPYLIISCVEVGSNDATNLVNPILGAKILNRKYAIIIAGIFVIMGAVSSSSVIDTVRKGIFDITQLDVHMSVSIFMTSYFVGTVLLYCFSCFALPVSTTAILVFCLAGSAVGASSGVSVLNWSKLFYILSAIIISIFLSGFVSFWLQKSFRKFISREYESSSKFIFHAPWISGFMLTSLLGFMLVKGMKYISFIKGLYFYHYFNDYPFVSLCFLWISITVCIYGLIIFSNRRICPYLFNITSIVGMMCMAFAFGQNDLANCASPGLANFMIWSKGLVKGTTLDVPLWFLFICGLLLFLGMLTKRAKKVTQAEIDTVSDNMNVALYSPSWCLKLAKLINKNSETISNDKDKKKMYAYDPLRASTILSVSACVIAYASSLGIPVSTTYVSFAAVVASGWGDGVFNGASSTAKLSRALWVVVGWFLSAVVAFLACICVAFVVYRFKIFGLLISFLLSIYLRFYFYKKSERQYSQLDSRSNFDKRMLVSCV
jgi:phosphate/sulfate permease